MKNRCHGYDRSHMSTSFTQLHPELSALLPPSLHEACRRVRYAKGERLFSAGDKPKFMFFIRSGEVLLERTGLQGESVVLQRTRSGIVSEASLQSPRYHCHANVVLASEITAVPIQGVAAALASDPAFSSRWIGMLNREVKRLRLQCERLSLHRVEHRLLHFLETEGPQGRYPLASGLKSLAGELGVTHEALYRCIAAMEKKRILRRDGTHLTIGSSTSA